MLGSSIFSQDLVRKFFGGFRHGLERGDIDFGHEQVSCSERHGGAAAHPHHLPPVVGMMMSRVA